MDTANCSLKPNKNHAGVTYCLLPIATGHCILTEKVTHEIFLPQVSYVDGGMEDQEESGTLIVQSRSAYS